MQVNDEIMRTEAAKTFWKTRDFDPIAITYVDGDKEKNFVDERSAKEKIHGKDEVKKLPLSVQNEAMMYNPINNCTQDEGRLQEKDQREKNKKQRYEARYVCEEATRNEMLAEKERLDNMSLAKVSIGRVMEELNRGHDILTNGSLRGGLA